MGVLGICRAFWHVKLCNTKIVQFYLHVLCGNAVVKVSLQLLGPCEMPLQHVSLPGNAHLTFHYTTERWHCMLQLL